MKLDRLALLIPAIAIMSGCPGDDTSGTGDTESTGGTAADDDDGSPTTTPPSTTMTTSPPGDSTGTPMTDDTGTPMTDDTGTPMTDDTGTPMTDSGSESGSESGTTAGVGDCVEITPGQLEEQGGQLFRYFGEMSGVVDDDLFQLEFYTGDTGLFDLASAGVNDNYISCEQCVRVFEDITDDPDRQYFQSEGMITISDDSDPLGSVVSVTTSGVTLVEVTVAADFTSTPVAGGACLTLADGTYETLMVDGWTCNIAFYGDGVDCDCGCGIADPDCADMAATSCDYCNDTGSCDITGNDCPGIIDPADNAICDTTPPAAWMCTAGAYADGTCDCGCGALDALDCADATSASCAECNGMGSCDAAGTDCSNISPNDNSQCVNPLCTNSSTDGTLAATDPTFNHPIDFGPGCTLSALGTAVFYDVHTFTAAGGSTDVTLSTCDMSDFDSVILVYQAGDGSADPFDPTDPCTNSIAYNDDGPGCGGASSLLNVTGLVDGEYQVVVAAYFNDDVGDYTLDLTCG